MKLLVLITLGASLFAGPALAEGDALAGEKVFKKCMACHTVTDKTNKVGPHLVGVVGRKAAVVEGFNYSDSMKEYAATGAVWDEEALDAYLENPKATVLMPSPLSQIRRADSMPTTPPRSHRLRRPAGRPAPRSAASGRREHPH